MRRLALTPGRAAGWPDVVTPVHRAIYANRFDPVWQRGLGEEVLLHADSSRVQAWRALNLIDPRALYCVEPPV